MYLWRSDQTEYRSQNVVTYEIKELSMIFINSKKIKMILTFFNINRKNGLFLCFTTKLLIVVRIWFWMYSTRTKLITYCCLGMNFLNSSRRLLMPSSVHDIILKAISQLQDLNAIWITNILQVDRNVRSLTDHRPNKIHTLWKFPQWFWLIHCFLEPFDWWNGLNFVLTISHSRSNVWRDIKWIMDSSFDIYDDSLPIQ